MRSFGAKLVQAAAVAGLLSGLAATPARADHDDHHWKGRHHGEYREHYYRPQTRYYYRDYGRDYYYEEPRVQYYAAPRVYVPAPPSFGLNLVFPFHHH